MRATPTSALAVRSYIAPNGRVRSEFLPVTKIPCVLPVNDARAMRITEIMTDFRNLQHYLAHLQASPTAEEYYLEGYALLRQCIAEAQAVLNTPFQAAAPAPGGNPEKQKQQLRA